MVVNGSKVLKLNLNMFAVFQPLVFANIPEIEYFRNSSSGDPPKNTHVSGIMYYRIMAEFSLTHNSVV